jgi:hypothetical protein
MSGHSFTRQELYDLVWSEPMTKLAARYGISGNGLAKACHRADIPVPERGYWAKQQAGHKVRKTPLPTAKASTPERVAIHPPVKRPPPPPPPPVPASVQAKIDNEKSSGKPVVVAATLSNPHRIVAGWLQDDRKKRLDARHQPWLRDTHKAIDGTDLDKRRLRILSALFKALEDRGYTLLVEGYLRQDIKVSLDHDNFELSLEERIQQVRRELTEHEKADHGYLSSGRKWTQERVRTGELVLKVREPNRYAMAREWRDGLDKVLEDKLGDVIADLAGLFEQLRLRRQREAEERARQWKIEEERRQIEMERKRETIRFRRLLGHCENWQTAAELRAFVAAMETSPLACRNPERYAEWKAWALGHADRIDPLRSDGIFNQTVSDHDVYMLKD